MPFFWIATFFVSAFFAKKRPEHAGLFILIALPLYLLRTQAIFPTTLLEAVVLGSLAGFFLAKIRSIEDVKKIWRDATPLAICAVALLAVASFAVAAAPDTRAALGLWRAYFLEPILAIPLILATLRDEKVRARLFIILAVEVLFLSLVAILQRIGIVPVIEPWTLEQRATSIFPFPNALGLFLAPLVVFFSTLALSSREKTRDRILFASATLAGLLAILAASSDGATVAVAASLFVLGLAWNTKTRLATMISVIMCAMVLISNPGLQARVAETITLQDWSGTVRRVMWQETVTMLKTRPILGAGLGGYPATVAPFHPNQAVEIFQYPHNAFLNIWSELGLLGLAAVAGLLVVFSRATHLLRRDETWPLRLASALAILAICIHGLVDVPYFKNDLAFLTWLFLVVPFAIKNPRARRLGSE